MADVKTHLLRQQIVTLKNCKIEFLSSEFSEDLIYCKRLAEKTDATS